VGSSLAPPIRSSDIIDAFGAVISLRAVRQPEPLLWLERSDLPARPTVAIGMASIGVVTAFLQVAALAVPDPVDRIDLDVPWPIGMALVIDPAACIILEQRGHRLVLPASAWARLAAELALADSMLRLTTALHGTRQFSSHA
jgi:hypothetical protein